ncbi:two-component system sensor histidine kinase BaeS [Planifilum fimeticola]|jgi:two-component system, OmpR family, sensor histidine kinase BaeS|uniref:histidine kinase n=1 Tax=Planifilum fimeticola TaxID=201975 RepID=A0A2T0LJI0_9BACL|nr:ATP-binding protein [Planifilum fimeticola]PRX42637.1 two-component system sensor histidine kinase BaeS [Planifilum fimeticola]
MSVSRKLFIAMAAFIVGMGLVFAFVTQIVLRDALEVLVAAPRKENIDELSRLFADHYEKSGGSWEDLHSLEIEKRLHAESGQRASIVLQAPNRQILLAAGEADQPTVLRFGIRNLVRLKGDTIGFLYYHDPAIDYMSRLRIGILDSTKFLLILGTLFLVALSLLVAYGLAKWLTAPLRRLIPAIDRLGKGELGIQVPVTTGDEYGKVANAFNDMSNQLKKAEEIRKNLVADVAHELRTPLTIIRGKLDFLQQSGRPIPPENLLSLQDELIRLTRLVEDLHQLTLAEAKQLPLERKPTHIPDLLRRILDRIGPEAANKGIHLSLEDFSGEGTLSVDPNRITQVFLNLLVNALRYTPSGGSIRVQIDREEGPAPGQDMLRVSVADTGTGIEPEHLPRLFDRFYRSDQARTRSRGGSGLGLAIAKEFVTAHGGTIDVESEPGRGTTFIVRLPCSK